MLNGTCVDRVRSYEFAKSLALTDVTRSSLTRWCDAGIIQPVGGGGGKGRRRQFGFRNLVEIAVAERARRLMLNEAGISAVVDAVRRCSPEQLRPSTPHLVFFGFESEAGDDPQLEPIAVVLAAGGTEDELNSGYWGVVIGLADIVWRLQQATGESAEGTA